MQKQLKDAVTGEATSNFKKIYCVVLDFSSAVKGKISFYYLDVGDTTCSLVLSPTKSCFVCPFAEVSHFQRIAEPMKISVKSFCIIVKNIPDKIVKYPIILRGLKTQNLKPQFQS